jgi:hypothetical protein
MCFELTNKFIKQKKFMNHAKEQQAQCGIFPISTTPRKNRMKCKSKIFILFSKSELRNWPGSVKKELKKKRINRGECKLL